MKRRRNIRVTVVGAVNKPGMYELSRSAGCLQALVAASGLEEDAGTKIEIRQPPHNGEPGEVMSLDLTDVGDCQTFLDLRLQDGCVVVVERVEPRLVEVIGKVKRPGQYEYPVRQDFRLLAAIALAGGLSSQLVDTVLITRQVAGREEPIVIKASIRKAKDNGERNLLLAPGDIVEVKDSIASQVERAFRVTVINPAPDQ
jgi:polysaccharide export outer membrane protein